MILVLMTSLMLWNASDLKQGAWPQYAGLCHRRLPQLTGDISARISACEQSLEVVAGSVPSSPDRDTLEDFLADRAEILGLTPLQVIGTDGGSAPPGIHRGIPGRPVRRRARAFRRSPPSTT